MSSFDDTYCSVYPAADSIIPPAVSTTQDHHFYIKIHAEFMCPPLADQDEDVPDYLNQETYARDTEAFVPRDLLTRNDTSWSVISGYLSGVGLPIHVQPTMIHRISSCAQEMASADHNVGRKVLPMTVFVSYADVDVDFDFEAAGPSMEGKPVPTRESTVEGLEKVILEKELNECAICMEGMEVGTEARRMPCEHCFHGDCIVKWLRISNFCPLCRFQMPID